MLSPPRVSTAATLARAVAKHAHIYVLRPKFVQTDVSDEDMRAVEIRDFRAQLDTSIANGFPGMDLTLVDETNDKKAPALCKTATISCDVIILQEIKVTRAGVEKIGLIAKVLRMPSAKDSGQASVEHRSALGDTITCRYPMTQGYWAKCRLDNRDELAFRLAEHHDLYHTGRQRPRP